MCSWDEHITHTYRAGRDGHFTHTYSAMREGHFTHTYSTGRDGRFTHIYSAGRDDHLKPVTHCGNDRTPLSVRLAKQNINECLVYFIKLLHLGVIRIHNINLFQLYDCLLN